MVGLAEKKLLRVKVRYFASLRDSAGISEEWFESFVLTPSEAYDQLKLKYGFALNSSELRAAVNGRFVEMNLELKNGDELVFIPPVSGG